MFFYYEADSADPIVAAALGTLYGVGLTSWVRINGVNSQPASWTEQTTPLPNNEWKNIWGGQRAVFAKNNADELYFWGYNAYGALGLGDTTAKYSPTLFTGAQDFVDMDSWIYHSVAVDSSGQLWTTGRNHYGQLGLGDTTDRTSWTQVTEALDADGNTISLPAISKVFCADSQILVLTTGGDVYSCGQGHTVLGRTYSSINNKLKFVISGVQQLSVSQRLAIALKTDGTLTRWGYDGTTFVSSPQTLSTDTDWTKVAASYSGFAAVNSSNELFFIGRNYNGEFGGVYSVGTRVDSLTKLTSWSGGNIEDINFTGIQDDACFIRTSDKKLYVSGDNDHKQLGLGTNISINEFTETQTGVLGFVSTHETTWVIKE